jgi:hypothetical protein
VRRVRRLASARSPRLAAMRTSERWGRLGVSWQV